MRSIRREVGGVSPDRLVLFVRAGRRVTNRKAGGLCFGPLEVENYVLIVVLITGAVLPRKGISIW